MAEPPRRPHFFDGQLLASDDLAAEQDYHRQMRYLHNRLHGYGVASGLEVGVGRGRIRVDPGLALDALGREIVLVAAVTLPVPPPPPDGRRWVRDLVIGWRELPECPVPRPDGEPVPSRWVEEPEVRLVGRGRSAPEELALARLSRTGRGPVAVEPSVRRPLGLD